ncbi:hypothetical protein [Mucilaginibacter sp. PAMB04168]|uniref:hypothetical protein n=1 Tax=Mucilaginibacter sp. PAMB04168 TaxID=3138567 RepID=UPI0031F67E5F
MQTSVLYKYFVTLTLRLIDPANNNSVKDLASKTYNSSSYPRGRLGRLSFGWKGHEASQILSVTATLQAGQSVRVSYDISDSDTNGTVLSGARFTVTEKKNNVQPGRTVQCERILPDINQKDLLKDTLQRFGIICQTDALKKIVNLASLRDIVANVPRARDWTGKCLDQGKSISFKLGEYAQANILKYKEDEAIIPKTLGQAQIDVNDKTLPPTAQLFEGQFAPTLNSTFVNGTIALVKKANNEGEFSINTQPRLLVDEKCKLTNSTTVTFEDGKGGSIVVNDIISTPYFYKPDGQHNLCWADMPGNGSSNIRV